jgi:hypothetical protein
MLKNLYFISRLDSEKWEDSSDVNKFNLDTKIEEKIKDESLLFLKEIRKK